MQDLSIHDTDPINMEWYTPHELQVLVGDVCDWLQDHIDQHEPGQILSIAYIRAIPNVQALQDMFRLAFPTGGPFTGAPMFEREDWGHLYDVWNTLRYRLEHYHQMHFFVAAHLAYMRRGYWPPRNRCPCCQQCSRQQAARERQA